MDQFHWLLDEDTLLGHQMPVSIVGMRPERHVAEPNSFWDHGLMKEFCPHAEVDVIGDSDDFLMIELREKEVAQEQLVIGSAPPKELAEIMVTWVTPYQLDFARRPLTLHAGEVPSNVHEGRRKLADFVDKIFANLPDHLPSHIDHPQWNYHWHRFVEVRHEFLSNRLASLTETPAPPSLSPLDRCWWELDGVKKAYGRRCTELRALTMHGIDLLEAAIKEIDREFPLNMDQFEEDVLGQSGDLSSRSFEVFANVHLDLEMEISSKHTASLRDEWEHTFHQYEREHAAIKKRSNAKRAQLLRAIDHLKQYLQARVSSLDFELLTVERPLREKYERLLRRHPGTAAVPFVKIRRGSLALSTDESLPVRFVRRVYRTLYGKWPQVTQFSVYWSSVRHLLNVVETAKASGGLATPS